MTAADKKPRPGYTAPSSPLRWVVEPQPPDQPPAGPLTLTVALTQQQQRVRPTTHARKPTPPAMSKRTSRRSPTSPSVPSVPPTPAPAAAAPAPARDDPARVVRVCSQQVTLQEMPLPMTTEQWQRLVQQAIEAAKANILSEWLMRGI